MSRRCDYSYVIDFVGSGGRILEYPQEESAAPSGLRVEARARTSLAHLPRRTSVLNALQPRTSTRPLTANCPP